MTPRKKAWYEENKERIIKRVLTTRMKRLYGITPVDYAQMLVQQGYRQQSAGWRTGPIFMVNCIQTTITAQAKSGVCYAINAI